MFLDVVFNFCCCKRQKDKDETISSRSNKSQEDHFMDQRRMELDVGKTALLPEKRSKPASSLGSPTDNYLVLNAQPSQKKSSFEEEEPIGYSTQLSKTTYHPQPIKEIKRTFSQEKIDKGVKKRISKKAKNEDQKRVVKIWEPEEDANLKKLYSEFQGNWHKIVQYMPGRNISQCSQRWRRINPIQCKQKWTFEDDQRLIKLVSEKGKNWTQISKDFPGRTGKQIRERYLNKLDPQLKFGPWSKDEDEQILEYYKKYGAKWSLVSNHLEGRSENQVKNRFYSHIQKNCLGKQNPYYIVFNTGSKMDVEMSDSSDHKPIHSENYSSSFGQSFSLYDDEDNMDFDYFNNNHNGIDDEQQYQVQFQQDFQDKVAIC